MIDASKNWSAGTGRKFKLEKYQTVCIPMDKVNVGLGWEAGSIDIDTSILMMDANGNQKDIVYYGKKRSEDGAVQHGGDNLTGEGKGDDETVIVNLNDVDPNVFSLWPVINVYTANQQFDDVNDAYCRIVDTRT